MCGRYKQNAAHADVVKHFQLIDAVFEIRPRNEIFPGTDILAVDREHRPEMIHWTVEDCDHKGVMRKVINAKAETVHFVAMFRDAFKDGRVLIPATGFYEWKGLKDKQKEKYEFEFDEPLFAFAGIARPCEIKGEERNCGVILTTEANDVVRPIHAKNRMPVILHKYDYEKWLNPDTSAAELKHLMKPIRNEEIMAHSLTQIPPDKLKS
jgi:putative SOS response-associated peptidase YedK